MRITVPYNSPRNRLISIILSFIPSPPRNASDIPLDCLLCARYVFRTSIDYTRGVMRGTFSVPRLTIRKVLCKVRFPYLDWLYARGVMRGTFSVPRLALPCSKTKYDCTTIFLPSNLTLVIKSAEIMCCTHILILSSKGNSPCYYSMSVVVRGTYSIPRLALPCSKTDCDCTAIFLPSNLTLVIKSAEIMCCTHILILSSKANIPHY